VKAVVSLEELEGAIRAAVATAKAAGWRIMGGIYYVHDDTPCGCPLAAVVRDGVVWDNGDEMDLRDLSRKALIPAAVAKILGISHRDGIRIASGVDGRLPQSGDEFYDLGVRLRDVLDVP
jgi:hypothetical protein